MTAYPKTKPSRKTNAYTGRFAPSPSGPLHMGSLVCALASFLDARKHHGRWLLRIDDIDPPRQTANADKLIMHTLVIHGLQWDGEVLYQSSQAKRYQEFIGTLKAQNLIYPCSCNRKRLASLNHCYDGRCRDTKQEHNTACAFRFNTNKQNAQLTAKTSSFNDPIQGWISEDFTQTGDFIVHRKDGLFAYQLAASYDDYYQNITHIIRGSDLLSSAPKQRLLIQILNNLKNHAPALPHYAHIPTLLNSKDEKLSKQNHAPALNNDKAFQNVKTALLILGITPPTEDIPISDLLTWSIEHWDIQKIPKAPSIKLNTP